MVLMPIIFMMTSVQIQAQGITGHWKTIDDETGEARSIVEIYKEGDEFYGKIVELLDEEAPEICEKCKGEKKDQPMAGLVIIEGMVRNGGRYDGGSITDPANGKEYKCRIERDGDILKVRGFIGLSLLGRTQEWQRVENFDQ